VRGARIKDSLEWNGAEFHVVCVSTMIHQPIRIKEEMSSVALLKKYIVSISDFDNLCSKCKITRDSCIQLDFCNYICNENTWELFGRFFATGGTQNVNSFFLHKILVLN
jgi:hypothetical protein